MCNGGVGSGGTIDGEAESNVGTGVASIDKCLPDEYPNGDTLLKPGESADMGTSI
jgi:hypothetical protein